MALGEEDSHQDAAASPGEGSESPQGGHSGGDEQKAPPAQPPPSQDSIPPPTLSDLEACVLALINADREAMGLRPLTARTDLSDTADGHSLEMASHRDVYHRDQLRQGTPSDSQAVGENVGAGYACQEVHDAFMSSASHAGNVMRADFNFVGLGAAQDENGMYFVTQLFVKAPVPLRLDPVEVVATPPLPQPSPEPPPAPEPQHGPPAAASPSPPAPAEPGSKVTGKTAAYLGELEG